jgi:hypothetical protein
METKPLGTIGTEDTQISSLNAESAAKATRQSEKHRLPALK